MDLFVIHILFDSVIDWILKKNTIKKLAFKERKILINYAYTSEINIKKLRKITNYTI